MLALQRSIATKALRASLKHAPQRIASSSSSSLRASASFGTKARSAAPAIVSPLLQKSRSVAGLFAAGSTTAACTFCSSAPAAAAAAADATAPSVPKVTLYQYEPCPYCCKVKAVLDYLRIPYDVVEVNPLTKSETKALTDYKKVPVCTINGDVVVDSSAIISRLRELVHDTDGADALSDGVSLEEEERWRKWVDEKLILLTPPNIYRTFPESLEAFDYCLTEGKFTATERYMSKYAGAIAMYFIAKKLKTKYAIDDEREALYAAISSYLDAVGDRDFLGGSEPNMADLSVFGVVRSVAGLTTFDDIMANTAIEPWFTRMTAKVGPSMRVSSA